MESTSPPKSKPSSTNSPAKPAVQSEVVEDALDVYLSEVMPIRQTLDRRYDEIMNGEVKGIPAEEVIAVYARKTKPPVHKIDA